MRTLVAVALVAAAAFVLFAGGGCVSRKEYDEVVAMNRRAQAELARVSELANTLQAENKGLATDLANRDRVLKAKQDEIDLLDAANKALQAGIGDLKNRLANLSAAAPPPLPDILLPAAVDQALKELAQRHPDLIEYYPKYGMIKLKSDLTFDPGSDIVQPGAREALVRFAQIVNTEVAAKFNIYIAGHTDDMPIEKLDTKRRHPNNWYLSVHRAVAVQAELAKAGLAPHRIGAMGFGEYHPVAPNAPGKKGNKLNRRVELWVVPPDRFLTVTGMAAVAADESPIK